MPWAAAGWALGLAIAVGAAAPARAHGTIERVSVGPGGAQANSSSFNLAISADGRFVAFASDAANLMPGDTNGAFDVFVRDRWKGRTERVSVNTGGRQANGLSNDAALSADGRYVAFVSDATNLVPGDTNGEADVFVRDRKKRTTERVSVSTGGAQGNRWSLQPDISGDGRVVAFLSEASNLVPRDTNGVPFPDQLFDVFVRDRAARRTARVNLGPRGAEADGITLSLAISADGRFVAFESDATNLVPGDTNGRRDVFVRDREIGTTRRVSVGPGGGQGNGDSFNPAISADGRLVAFGSEASNLVPRDTNGVRDVFVRDRQVRRTARVSVGPGRVQANGSSWLDTAISADGRFVAFHSEASNLVPGDTNGRGDVFVHDRRTRATRRVSVGLGGVQSNGDENRQPALSAHGRYVAFTSNATNLVPGDTNGAFDVFVRTLVRGNSPNP